MKNVKFLIFLSFLMQFSSFFAQIDEDKKTKEVANLETDKAAESSNPDKNIQQMTSEDFKKIVEKELASLKNLRQKQKEAMLQAEKKAEAILKKFKIYSFAVFDESSGLDFIQTHRTLKGRIYFKNDQGKITTRKYQLDLLSTGLKAELNLLKFNILFFTDKNAFNLFDAYKTIDIKWGVEVAPFSLAHLFYNVISRNFYKTNFKEFKDAIGSTDKTELPLLLLKTKLQTALFGSACRVTYAKFNNLNGGMIMLSWTGANIYSFDVASYIYSGELKPI